MRKELKSIYVGTVSHARLFKDTNSVYVWTESVDDQGHSTGSAGTEKTHNFGTYGEALKYYESLK